MLRGNSIHRQDVIQKLRELIKQPGFGDDEADASGKCGVGKLGGCRIAVPEDGNVFGFGSPLKFGDGAADLIRSAGKLSDNYQCTFVPCQRDDVGGSLGFCHSPPEV